MAVTKEDKARLVKEYGTSEKDTGATKVQIALLTERISGLTEHFKVNKKDTNSKRGLMILIGQRRRLLKYLQRKDLNTYRDICDKLGIRK
ncbi:MAG TPA: 30S ribosomal protein S15 [Spirochaetales bacterium]|nr:30S ribosomal protein S15 [Spirochaetales bacterium]HPB65440.1 30S ribosomal protein S15 [Spirochaetales bacterium]HPG86435.1 30S ribosomal protein S15 [Spirochaetales bacterium]HPM73055.1 30S ribosomal protein S15 [Spirochaetales bacterium]HQO65202.1 30S ribosomal protein S15 [Spirochaetales bacterium]